MELKCSILYIIILRFYLYYMLVQYFLQISFPAKQQNDYIIIKFDITVDKPILTWYI